ncbi:MAG: hypothetical protein KR126chlam2_00352 [Chlamydiae bacterium]|nr:hypothetical protein [Chlamydiota bacterium]
MTSCVQLQFLDTKGMGAHETFLSPQLRQSKRISQIVLTVLFCAAFVTSVALLAFTAPFHLGVLVIPVVVCGAAICLTLGLFHAVNEDRQKANMARHLKDDNLHKLAAYLRKGKELPYLVKMGFLTEKEAKALREYFRVDDSFSAYTEAHTHLLFTDDAKFSKSQSAFLRDEVTYPEFIQNLALLKTNPDFK